DFHGCYRSIMPQFTPGSALAGGALIGLASAALLVLSGKIAGISGILDGALRRDRERWQVAFLAGLILAGAAATLAVPSRFGAPPCGSGRHPVCALLAPAG